MKRRLCGTLLLILLMAACGTVSSTAKSPIPSTVDEGDSGFNLLIVAEGDIQLKREGWPDFHPTAFGAELRRGDQLRLANDAKAVVLCDSLTLWIVPVGEQSGLTNGCPQPPEPALHYPHGRIANTRGENDPLIPYIISPRSTYLLTGTPMLRWNTVPGVATYRVRVRDGNLDWEASVTDNEAIYPGEPRLEPGKVYLLVVEAGGGTSSLEEDADGLGFILLTEDEASAVRTAEEKLHSFNLPASTKVYARAKLYMTRRLIAEATEMLQAFAVVGTQHSATYRTLGDLYAQVGLNWLAEARYLRATELAQAANDLEGQALAQLGLGNATEALGRIDESTRWLTQALAGFETLGDERRVSELTQRLARARP